MQMTVLWVGKSVSPLAVGGGFIQSSWTGFWKSLPHRGILCSASIQGEGFGPALTWYSRLYWSPHERLYPFWGVDAGLGWGGERWRDRRRRECRRIYGWYVKRNAFKIQNLKKFLKCIFKFSFYLRHRSETLQWIKLFLFSFFWVLCGHLATHFGTHIE